MATNLKYKCIQETKMIDIKDLQSALKKQGLTLDDVTYAYSIEKGIVDVEESLSEDTYVFTRDFVYIISQYDGQYWFEAVPRSVDAAKDMDEYGDYGG